MSNNILNISDLSVKLDEKWILKSIKFDLEVNQILAIVGKSGVGKTTLLKTIAGLIKPVSGEVRLKSEIINSPSNKIGLVFQDYFVFPWLNVERNILLGFKHGRNNLSENDIKEKMNWLLKSNELYQHRNKYSHQLSGGMLQRVALCRALAANPNVLLLDEPFGALDLVTRINLHNLINSIFEKVNQSIIIVTHNINEAVSLADKVILISDTPAIIKSEWEISEPRTNKNFLKLNPEQEQIVEEILIELNK